MVTPKLGFIVSATLALAACTQNTDREERDSNDGELARGPIGKADLAGSCAAQGANSCGGPAQNGNCWCDDLCEGYGDCCSDYVTECLACEPSSCGAEDCGHTDDGCGGELDCPCTATIAGHSLTAKLNTKTTLDAYTSGNGQTCSDAMTQMVWGGWVNVTLAVSETNGGLQAELHVEKFQNTGSTFMFTFQCTSTAGSGCSSDPVTLSVPLSPLQAGMTPLVPMSQGWLGKANYPWGTVEVSANSSGVYLRFDAQRHEGSCAWASNRFTRRSVLWEPPPSDLWDDKEIVFRPW